MSTSHPDQSAAERLPALFLSHSRPGERVRTLFEGFRYGTISMRSFAVG